MRSHHMRNALADVDRMVLSLKALSGTILAPAAVVRFEICLSEAFTNVIKHAHPTNPQDPIDIVISEHPEAVIVEIFDPQGATFFSICACMCAI